ncbi:MAG: arginine--tRNA ligase [Chiayiivirga sp.]|uniref:arginine--tRNA ligase n=1 Tax=Chiayiivirga sp. TaxID=2041042 RepID=UPI0025B8ED38|nr:arginine--tRNA ligase [Chiayiivirga sp.]MCI1711519.1 arginine--tRNA ligase [Chiayiivirga sp.]MCI1730543.1 arginine--tRNA ligase [Chiayiivirga sp.]
MKDHLRELVLQALLDLKRAGVLPAEAEPAFVIERTKSREHGDYATNVALLLAKLAGRKPRELAEALAKAVPRSQHLAKVEIAGPGFINFHLNQACRLGTLRRVFEQGERYGYAPAESREPVQVEFVSANPNGPLHVGHGRGAAYGASVANLLEAAGHRVQREYYVNDAGRQMDILAVSVWLRYLELGGVNVRFPDNGYKGDYVVDIARGLRAKEGDRLRHNAIEVADGLPADASQGGDKEVHVDALIGRAKSLLGEADYRRVFDAGLGWCLSDIREDLLQFGVRHDNFFSERSLMTDGFVQRAIDTLRANGHLFEQDGATWFRATAFGDDKDRVVVRENGVTTYFASDLGYLLSKFERGFERAIYVLGADHHGYIARLKAAAQGLGLDPNRIEIPLVQFAILFRGAERVQMSTRAGSFVTLRELREEVGTDAARFFYVMRGNDQHLDFDLELAKSHSNDNPVYYVQYAHARVCALMRQLAEKLWSFNRTGADQARALLTHAQEDELLGELMRFPESIEAAAANRAPQVLATYLRELAASFHSYYNAVAILVPEEDLRSARLGLCLAVRQVLANGLSLLGVSAPEKM